MKTVAQLKDGWWHVGTNRWDANITTKAEAVKYASTLIGCRNCRNCRNCSYCRDCGDCSNCRYCSYCDDCSNCSGFKSNPQRITSGVMGSRNSQSTYYWNDEHEQVVCGCFKGSLQEFENRVKDVHGENEFGVAYMKWINTIKVYKETGK